MIVRFIFGFMAVCCFAAGGIFMYFYTEVKHDMNAIINYHPKLTTEIYDKNNNLIANVFDEENRVYVKYDDIPGRVIEALVAIEDTNFLNTKE